MSVSGGSNRDRTTPSSADVRLSTRWEAFVLALMFLSISNIAIVAFARLEEIGELAATVDIVISFVFLGDFLRRLSLAANRRAYMLHGYGWFDLVGCVPVLRLARLVRVRNELRQLRKSGGVRTVTRQVFANRAEGSLLFVLVVAFYVIEFGSMAILAAEARSPAANIQSSSDALWFMMATISTVGYGDLYPTTTLGRIVGVIILIVGVGLFSTLTGFLANIFVNPTPRAREPSSSLPDGSGSPSVPEVTATATIAVASDTIRSPAPMATPLDPRP